MSRAGRFTSAALGMLMIAGLAYYQGHDDPTAGEQGSLIGTAVSKNGDHRDIDCDQPESLDDKDREYCKSRKSSG